MATAWAASQKFMLLEGDKFWEASALLTFCAPKRSMPLRR